VTFSSDVKLCHADGRAAEKLCVLKLTVLVLGVTKSPRSADRRCRRVAIAVTGVSERCEPCDVVAFPQNLGLRTGYMQAHSDYGRGDRVS